MNFNNLFYLKKSNVSCLFNDFRISTFSSSLNFLSKNSLYTINVRYTGGKVPTPVRIFLNGANKSSTNAIFTKAPDVFSNQTKFTNANNSVEKSSETTTSTVSTYQNFCDKSGLNRIAQGSVSNPRVLNALEKAEKHNMLLSVAQKKNSKTLYVFCEQFTDLTVEEIRKDKNALQYFNKLFEEHSTLMQTRMGALLWEVCYGKRNFDKKTLQDILSDNRVSIESFPGMPTSSTVDQSTVYNAYLAKQLLTSDSPLSNIKDVTVIAIPPGGVRVEDLSLNSQKIVEYVKKSTGNTFNDINLGSHSYDFKNIKDPGIGKNHIYFYDQEDLNKALKYFNKMEEYFRFKINFGNPSKMEKEYFQKSLTVLEDIKNLNISSVDKKLEIWNEYVARSMEKRPPGCYFSIFHRITTQPFTSDLKSHEKPREELKRLHVDGSQVREAVKGHISENKNKMGHSAKEGTNGAIDVVTNNVNNTENDLMQ